MRVKRDVENNRHISVSGRSFMAFVNVSVICLSLILTGCGNSGSASKKQLPPPPQNSTQAEENQGPTPMDSFRELAQPEGLVFKQLFREPLEGDARITRIERAVQNLRNDFDTTVPTLVRLAAIEQDIRDLVQQLESLANQEPTVSQTSLPPQTAPTSALEGEAGRSARDDALLPDTASAQKGEAKPLPSATQSHDGQKADQPIDIKPQRKDDSESKTRDAPKSAETKDSSATEQSADTPAPKPAAAESGNMIRDLRIGDHLDKTRLVLDMMGKPSYTTRFENDAMRLIIDVKGGDWQGGSRMWEASSAALVASYTVQKTENGEKIIIDLLAPATIQRENVIDPNADNKSYRLLFDLFSNYVHNSN